MVKSREIIVLIISYDNKYKKFERKMENEKCTDYLGKSEKKR